MWFPLLLLLSMSMQTGSGDIYILLFGTVIDSNVKLEHKKDKVVPWLSIKSLLFSAKSNIASTALPLSNSTEAPSFGEKAFRSVFLPSQSTFRSKRRPGNSFFTSYLFSQISLPFHFLADVAVSLTIANGTSLDNTTTTTRTTTSRPSVVESETQATIDSTTAAKEKASDITTFTFEETMSSSSGQKKSRMLNTACTGRSCVLARADGGEWIFCLEL